jgi:hypothetical protein
VTKEPILIILAILLLFLGISKMKPELLSVARIWNQAEHCAFTDLIEYQGIFFCCFREADEHALGENGSVRILKSVDGIEWLNAAFLKKEGFDLRDPQFSIMPDGRLMLILGGSIYRKGEYLGCSSQVTFSDNGVNWSKITSLEMPNEWIWRVTWHEGYGYGVSYRLSNPADVDQPWIQTLFQTKDGLHYVPITQLVVPNHASEATLRFLSDGTMVALTRRYGSGWIGTSIAPYTFWHWSKVGFRLGGPNFLILPDEKMWAASRLYRKEAGELRTYTAIYRMTLTSCVPELILPSGGDTGYPGMVYHNGTLYVSYYSSHEEHSSIYLAQVLL